MSTPTTRNRQGARRGYALLEVAMAMILLFAATALTVRVVFWVGLERRAADRRLRASLDLSNVMERVVSVPFDDVTAARVRSTAEASDEAKVLPGAEWTADVRDEDGPGGLAGRRVTLKLRWRNRAGEWDAPAALTAWVYRAGGRS